MHAFAPDAAVRGSVSSEGSSVFMAATDRRGFRAGVYMHLNLYEQGSAGLVHHMRLSSMPSV